MSDQEAASEAPIESPCISVCQVDGDDVCIGCGRTIDEIVSWLSFSERERARAVSKAKQRLREKQRP